MADPRSQVDNLTTATNTTAMPRRTEAMARFVFTGTYTGVTGGVVQGSADGTNYVNIASQREDTGAAFNGTISASNFSVLANVNGWAYTRFLIGAIGSGTLTVRQQLGTNFDLPPGVQSISLSAINQTITSTSANALAVGAGGTTNPALKVDASASSAATGLAVTAAAAGSGLALTVLSSGSNDPLTVDAKGSGTVTIGATSTGAVTIGATSQALVVPGPLTRGVGASTAAAGTTTSDAGALPAGTAGVYPTTGADDTKGVVIHANDKVTGRMLFVGNGVSNKILKIYPPSGGTINGAAADAAFSTASGKGAWVVCLSSGSNTWLAL